MYTIILCDGQQSSLSGHNYFQCTRSPINISYLQSCSIRMIVDSPLARYIAMTLTDLRRSWMMFSQMCWMNSSVLTKSNRSECVFLYALDEFGECRVTLCLVIFTFTSRKMCLEIILMKFEILLLLIYAPYLTVVECKNDPSI